MRADQPQQIADAVADDLLNCASVDVNIASTMPEDLHVILQAVKSACERSGIFYVVSSEEQPDGSIHMRFNRQLPRKKAA